MAGFGVFLGIAIVVWASAAYERVVNMRNAKNGLPPIPVKDEFHRITRRAISCNLYGKEPTP